MKLHSQHILHNPTMGARLLGPTRAIRVHSHDVCQQPAREQDRAAIYTAAPHCPRLVLFCTTPAAAFPFTLKRLRDNRKPSVQLCRLNIRRDYHVEVASLCKQRSTSPSTHRICMKPMSSSPHEMATRATNAHSFNGFAESLQGLAHLRS